MNLARVYLISAQPSGTGMRTLSLTGERTAVLAEGADGSLLVLVRFPVSAPTPIHNHNTWGIVCAADRSISNRSSGSLSATPTAHGRIGHCSSGHLRNLACRSHRVV
jgi:hypothetical protein